MVNQSQFIERYGNSPKQCIGDIAKEWSKGQPFKKDNIIESGSTPCIHYGELFTKYGPYIDDVCSTTNDAAMKVSQVGDILFPASDVTPNGLTRCSAIMRSGVLLGGDIIILRLREGLSPEYTSYAICMQKQQLLECITGSVIKHLSAKSILNVKVPIPANRKDQDAFVAIMRQADKSKFAGFKSQFIARFGTTDCSPFHVKSLREISLSSGEYGANTPATKYNSEVGRYIRITDIDEFGNLNNDIVSPEVAEDKYLLQKGDLLFARTGATVGKTYLHKEGKALYAGYLIKYRFTDAVLPDFVFAYTHSQEYYKWVELTQKVGAQPNISAKQYDGLKIIVPPIEEQKSFVALMHQADKSKYLN